MTQDRGSRNNSPGASLAPPSLDVLLPHRFPSPALVGAAADLFTPLPARWSPGTHDDDSGGTDAWGRERTVGAGGRRRRRASAEGARPRLIVGPGVLAVSEVNPARAERARERLRAARQKDADLRATDALLEERRAEAWEQVDALDNLAAVGLIGEGPLDEACTWAGHLTDRIARRDREDEVPAPRITSWSRRSRARMTRRLAELDYGPLLDQPGTPAMLTLTYPGDWLPVAGSAAACKRHVDAFLKRFRRAYGRPLVGIWKREFQRRGAPHYHIFMVPPRERIAMGGREVSFGVWASRTWADVVAHPDPEQRKRHVRAGTGIDYAEGLRARDPKRLAVYFSKHGAYAAKDYQNDAPAAWTADGGSVGRFWGVWGLDVATAVVEVSPVEAVAAARTLRRWQRANGYRVQREVWRTSWRRVNRETGELVPFKRKSGAWSGARMRGRLGFVVVNDGAALASQLAPYLDQVREAAQGAELARLGATETGQSVQRFTYAQAMGLQQRAVDIARQRRVVEVGWRLDVQPDHRVAAGVVGGRL